MKDDTAGKDIVPAANTGDAALDAAAFFASAIPWLGGPISTVLSGVSGERRMERVRGVLAGVVDDLGDFKSAVSEEYVRTEDFEELLERTLRQAADERHEEKRAMYRAFLVDAIVSPSQGYDEQVRHLRTLEDLQPDHIRVLKALDQKPESLGSDMAFLPSSPIATLQSRLPDMQSARIKERIDQLSDLRLVNLPQVGTMMTSHGAQNLVHSILPYGRRFMEFIHSESTNR